MVSGTALPNQTRETEGSDVWLQFVHCAYLLSSVRVFQIAYRGWELTGTERKLMSNRA